MQNTDQSFKTTTYIGLFDKKGAVEIDKVIDFMDISKAELASSFGFTNDQLRPNRMGSKIKEVIGELAGSIEYVANIFSGDTDKTQKWFNLPNVHFGGSTPKKIILAGRFHKVKFFIYSSQSQ